MTFQEGIKNETVEALHSLHESEASIDTVKELIQAIPSALLYTDEDDQLLIQSAICNDGTHK